MRTTPGPIARDPSTGPGRSVHCFRSPSSGTEPTAPALWTSPQRPLTQGSDLWHLSRVTARTVRSDRSASRVAIRQVPGERSPTLSVMRSWDRNTNLWRTAMTNNRRTINRTSVIAVGNQKGGVGKTTTTVNLAAALGTMGYKSLIIDLDANCGATRCLRVPPDSYQGSYEVMLGDEDPVSVALETDPEEGIELPDGVSLIPANRDLERVDSELIKVHRLTDYRDCLRRPIEKVVATGRWNFVFLDTAPNINTPTAAAYRVAEWFILAATPERLAIEGLNDAMSDIETVRQYNNPNLRLLGVVLSCVNRRTRLATEIIGWVEETFRDAGEFGDFKSRISSTVEVPMAQQLGKTILQTEPGHKVAEEYRQLAKEVMDRLQHAADEDGAGEGSHGEAA